MHHKEKLSNESAIEDHTYAVFPNDLNSHNTLFGGILMGLCDRVAAVVAARHAGCICVTACVDSMHFLEPVRKGDLLVIKASVNRTFRTSMEIGVCVMAEDIKAEAHHHVVSAYFTFVALNDHGVPQEVPTLIIETQAQRRRYEEAAERRERRQKRAAQRRLRHEQHKLVDS